MKAATAHRLLRLQKPTPIGLVEWQRGMYKAVRLRSDALDDEPLMEPRNIVPSIVRRCAVVIRSKLARGVYFAEKNDMTINAAAGRYFTDIADDPTTDYQLANLVRIIGKEKMLTEITNNAVSLFVAKRRGEKNTRYKNKKEAPHVPPATVNRETELLRRLMNKAKKAWDVAVNDVDWGEHLLEEPQERIRELTGPE